MKWYYVLICCLASITAGIVLGIFIEKLGQYFYFRRVNKGGNALSDRGSQLTQRSKIINAQNCEVLFLGDSITELYPIEEFYLGEPYLNRGIGGDTTSGVLARLESQVILHNPKKIILLIGTNDLNNCVGQAKILANIESIIVQLKNKLPNCEIFIESVYPVNSKMHKNAYRTNSAIDVINLSLLKLCESQSVKFVDTHEILKDSDGQLKKEYTYDGLHLTLKGYRVLTDFLIEKLGI